MELLTEKQAAEFFPGIKPATLRRWRQMPGVGPSFVKVGSRVFYPKDEIEAFLKALPRRRSTLELG